MPKMKNLAGNKYDLLTVIERTDDYISPKGQHQTRWFCECECGNFVKRTTTQLKSKTSKKSCGCANSKRQLERELLKSGEVFGKLTVTRDEYRTPDDRPVVDCICLCGSESISVRVDSLLSNNTQSCGCLVAETSKLVNKTHGRSKDPVYKNYYGMLARCYNEKHESYPDYGGRGIIVAEESWKEPDGKGFLNFIRDMGEPPEGCSIERLDVNKNYCKENCIWATGSVQMFNRRKTSVNTSGRTGVFWHNSREKYIVKVTKEGKEYWGGQYKDFDSACKAVSDLEIELFGFSRENQQ